MLHDDGLGNCCSFMRRFGISFVCSNFCGLGRPNFAICQLRAVALVIEQLSQNATLAGAFRCGGCIFAVFVVTCLRLFGVMLWHWCWFCSGGLGSVVDAILQFDGLGDCFLTQPRFWQTILLSDPIIYTDLNPIAKVHEQNKGRAFQDRHSSIN